jgi:hypothetical protein
VPLRALPRRGARRARGGRGRAPDQLARQHAGGGGAVARGVVGLARNLLDELRARILSGVGQADGARDGHAVVDDLRHAELLLQHHVAACARAAAARRRDAGEDATS